MKIKMTWKDPDAVTTGIEMAMAENGTKAYDRNLGGWNKEAQAIFDELDKLKIGEYICLDYDTDTKEVKFVPY